MKTGEMSHLGRFENWIGVKWTISSVFKIERGWNGRIEGISQAAQFYNEDIRKIEQQIAQSRKKEKDEDGGDVTPVEPETTTVQPE